MSDDKKPSVLPHYTEDFQYLIEAAKAGTLVMIEAEEIESGETHALLCAVWQEEGEDHVDFYPMAIMGDADLITRYKAPPATRIEERPALTELKPVEEKPKKDISKLN